MVRHSRGPPLPWSATPVVRLVLPLRHPHAFEAVSAGTRTFGTDRATGILFYGPPGTGKTTAARIAAAQAGLPLVYVPLEALMSKWYGKAEKQLARLFDHCAALGRCVLFLDELDALAGSRSREIDDASRRMLSVMLRRLDGMEAQPDTTLIGATNRRSDLDAALLSRFDVRVHFPAPDAAARAQIFGLYAQHLAPDALSALGAASSGLSGRDLVDVCRSAERRWVCKLLKGEVSEPPLPPYAQYDAAVANRLESSAEVDGERREVQAAAATSAGQGQQGGTVASWRATRRLGHSPASFGVNVVGAGTHWSERSSVRPPGW